MKNVQRLLLGMAMALAVLDAGVASASGLLGIPNAVGGYSPDLSSQSAHIRVRINGTCDTNPVQNLYIILRSGPLNDSSAELNSLYMKNAHSTLLTALLSGKTVEIQGLPDCIPNARGEIFVDVSNANVGVLQ